MGVRGPPLSAPEDKEMKKKLRNRESALAARERKKQKMLELERKVNELGKENDDLRNENNILKGTLSSVMKKYGAPSDEIKETLKIAEAKKTKSQNIKKEPADESSDKKGNQEKRNIIRPSQKVGSGPGKKRDNPNIKQEITESLIKLPKVASTTHSIQFKPTGHCGNKMVKKLYIHNNQIILDSTKLFQAAGAKSGQLITTTAALNSDKTQTTNHMTSSPTTSEQMIKQEPQDLPLRGRTYSPPWTPPDMSMQNSPSSDSAYSTGSENNGPSSGGPLTPIQLYPIKLPGKRQIESNHPSSNPKVHILDNEYESYDGETLYDTEIRYDATYDNIPNRVPKFHSHHELVDPIPTRTICGHRRPQTGQEWINMLQSDVQFNDSTSHGVNNNAEPSERSQVLSDHISNTSESITSNESICNHTKITESLKPEDFLTQEKEHGTVTVKAEVGYGDITSGLGSDNGSYTNESSTSNSLESQNIFQTQILNIDDIFLDHI